MLKKDNWVLGLALGVIVPLVMYGILYILVHTWGNLPDGPRPYYIKESTMHLIAIFSNLFTFRYYMVNLKYDKTGRGILMVTFIFAGVFFFLHL